MLLLEFQSGKDPHVYIAVGKHILLPWSSLIKVVWIIMKSQRGAQTFAYHCYSRSEDFDISSCAGERLKKPKQQGDRQENQKDWKA